MQSCKKQGAFDVRLFTDVIEIYPRSTFVATVTKNWEF